MTSATYTTQEFADLLGVASWTVYDSIRRGEPPVPPIKVGRRIVWPKALVDNLLGIQETA